MTRSASHALTTLPEARTLLLDGVRPVAPERLAVASAIGLVSAADLAAPADVPARRGASLDGWAVEAALLAGASPYAPVTLASAPTWVEAGAPLPDGADAVLPPEGLSGRDVVEDVAALGGVRETGEDARRDERLIAAGERLTASALPVLVAAGVAAVEVRRPRILIVATGDEKADGVSPMLAALIAADGGESVVAAVPDDVEAIAAALSEANSHAVIIVGGAGFGRTDFSAAGLALAGEVRAHGIALRPGENAGVGRAAGRPVLLAPGRPEAALAVFLTLGRPLVAALSGRATPKPARAQLRAKIASVIGLDEIVFVRRREDGVEPLGGADLPLKSLAAADGAVLVEPEREGYPEGVEVEVLPL